MQEFAIPPLIAGTTFSENNEETHHGSKASMRLENDYPYRQLHITVFPPVRKYTQERLRLSVLHEMLHVALARLRHMRKDVSKEGWRTLEEEVVELIAHVMNNNAKRGI